MRKDEKKEDFLNELALRKSMENIIFRTENVTTAHKKFKIEDITFELKNGEIMGLMGRSGSGKSTIIKTLIGLKKPRLGQVTLTIDNKEVSLNRFISYSPQENSLYPFLTVEENLDTFAKLYNQKPANIKKRKAELLKKLRLENSAKKKIIQLSGGMQKRADLAVTLIHSPKIIFFDEPFAGLDIALRNFMWEFIRDISRQGNIIVISSHSISELQKFCTKFGLVAEGRFYNTQNIKEMMKNDGQKDLESYMENLFAELERI